MSAANGRPTLDLDALLGAPQTVALNGRTLTMAPIKGRSLRKIAAATQAAQKADAGGMDVGGGLARVWIEILCEHLTGDPAATPEELEDLTPAQLGALISLAASPIDAAQAQVERVASRDEGNAPSGRQSAAGTPPPSAA